jgi:hypothetical protein
MSYVKPYERLAAENRALLLAAKEARDLLELIQTARDFGKGANNALSSTLGVLADAIGATENEGVWQ